MPRFLIRLLCICALPALLPAQSDPLHNPQEKHLRNIRQLTFGGQNAEAYFSPDGKQLIFQSTRDGGKCDQEYVMNVDGSNVHRVSNGQGRTTCGYFLADGKHIIYSSTHVGDAACPPPPDFSKGYRWALYPSYDIFVANADGSGLKQLTTTPGYDAEATLSPDGKKLVFTSTRNGDIDIYTINVDGSHVKQLTHELGYDGGPFYSRDGKWIVYRAYHPATRQDIDEYQALLKQNMIHPTTLELWVMKPDGSQKRQVTHLNAASFAPYFYPDGRRIIFSSNIDSEGGGMGNFELYSVKLDGSGLERITFSPGFDGFPVFSPDGKQLVWASNRNAKAPRETNIFIAEWVE